MSSGWSEEGSTHCADSIRAKRHIKWEARSETGYVQAFTQLPMMKTINICPADNESEEEWLQSAMLSLG